VEHERDIERERYEAIRRLVERELGPFEDEDEDPADEGSMTGLVAELVAWALEHADSEVEHEVETRDWLTLEDLEHDSERNRAVHSFEAGYDDTVPNFARCGTLVFPPYRPRDTPLDCVVCAAWIERRDELLRLHEAGLVTEDEVVRLLS
jgi:hypothetical protein